jgi:hypothetical protein
MPHMQTPQSTQSRSLRTARYVLAFTDEEKAQLDQKCRELAAKTGRRVTLAHALRVGAQAYLDEALADDPTATPRLA